MDLQSHQHKLYRRLLLKILHKIIVLVIAAAIPLSAADVPVITLEDAIESAKENNISIKSAQITLNQAIRNADNAAGTFMPDIRLNAGLEAGGDFPPAVQDPEYTGLSLSAGASASFPFRGSMINDGKTRTLERESASLAFQNDYSDIEQSVVNAYWAIAANKVQAESAETLAKDAERQYQSSLEMYESGIADELTLNQSELAYNKAMLTVKSASDSLENSKDVLRTLTGIDGDFTISPIPDTVYLSFPAPYEIFSRYSDGNIGIKRSRNNLESARIDLESSKFDAYIPSLTADLSYSYRGGWNEDWDYSSSSHGLSGGVSISLPIGAILPGGSSDSAIKDAEDLVASRSLALQKSQEDLLSGIRDSIARIVQYQDSMDMAEKSVKSAERTYELMNEAYDAGLVTASELADTRTDLLTTQFEALSYDINQLLESYRLAYMLNIGIDELQAEYGIRR